MNYKVFLIRSDSDIFLFNFESMPVFRPHLGDVLTSPKTLENFKILRDEISSESGVAGGVRFNGAGDRRVTSFGGIRITESGVSIEDVTHNYFVTPANNPNRISSFSTPGFANDQTLRQLFR